MAKAVTTLASRIFKPAIVQKSFPLLPKAVQYSKYSTNAMDDIVKPRETSMKKKLTEAFKPKVFEIVNESYMHNVPKGSETHFKVIIVSDSFEGVSLVQRHRLVNTNLEEEFANGLHALSIVAKTPSQWDKSPQTVSPSPPCRGGAGL